MAILLTFLTVNGINSSDPSVRGEALVDALALGSVATAVTGKLVQSGVSVVKAGVNGSENASVARIKANEIASTRVDLNLYRDWPVALDMVQYRIMQLAERATQNPAADTVVLGKFVEGSASSYEQVAKAQGATHFEFPGRSWSDAELQLGTDKMWLVNKQFLDNQIVQGKNFAFTADPATAKLGSYTQREVDHLLNSGYKITKDGDIYRAFKK